MDTERVLSEVDSKLGAALDRLKELVRIESISTDPAYSAACREAADWLARDLASIGFDAASRDTPGKPVVMASCGTKKTGIRVLFYGHYDVQPVDPLELWDCPPFDPQIQDSATGPVLRGRGTSDDKGQLMTFVEACRAWKSVAGDLPLATSVFIEGEEESGSPSLVPFMESHRDELASDVVLICDTGMLARDAPAVVTMLRGILAEEVVVHGPTQDLHSGMYGGPAINPCRALCSVLAALHDSRGRVTLEGFYDGVPELPEQISRQWNELAFDAGAFLGQVGLATPAGECDRSVLEQVWSRPTCEINGLGGGYSGEGFKTVLPAEARAKVSFRLVGSQDPQAIRESFRAHVRAELPPDCRAEFKSHAGSGAMSASIRHPAFEAARRALAEEWGKEAVYVGCGGSIPVAGHFKSIIGSEPLMIGFGQDDDAIHSPNEKYDVRSFHKGIRSWVRILAALART